MKRVSVIAVFVFFTALAFSTIGPGPAAAADGSIQMKLANFMPQQAPLSQQFDRWAQKVNDVTQGKVEIKVYHSGSLVAYKDVYRSIQGGIADMGFANVGGTAGLDPLNNFTSLPLMGWDSPMTATKVYYELREKFPQLDAEYKGVKLLWCFMFPAQSFHFTERIVRVPDDIKGVKLLSGPTAIKIANALGYVSVTKGPPDWYMSIQRGLAEGILNHWPACEAFKLTELFRTHTNLGNSGINMVMGGIFMNQKSWDKLPKNIQKSISDLNPWIEREMMDMDAKAQVEIEKKAEAEGHKIIRCTPEEIQLWADKTEPVRKEWVEEIEKKGLPGEALMAEAKKLIEIYNKK